MNRKWLWALGGVIVLALAGFGAWRLLLHHPLPDPGEIEYVTARFYHRDKQRDVEVVIPDNTIPELWSRFQPASKVTPPIDAPIWGDMKLTTKDRRFWTITLFDAGGTLYYEVGVDLEPRSYYRAGNLHHIEQLLKNHDTSR
jgi:hypothetical protein